MVEKEYLKFLGGYARRQYRIYLYKIGALSLIIAGTVLLTIGCAFLTLSGSFVSFVFFIGLSGACLILGVWTKSKVRKLEVELNVYEKERERKKAQHPQSPYLYICPSCGKKASVRLESLRSLW